MEVTESKTGLPAGILGGLQKKETSSLSTLFDAYSSLVYDYFIRVVKEPKAAEQLLMGVFINAWFGAQEIGEEQTDAHQWLLGIVSQVAADRLKIEKGPVFLPLIKDQAEHQLPLSDERQKIRETILKFREQLRY